MKILYFLFFGAMLSSPLWACDGGCNLGSSYSGIFPQWEQNFLGLNYRYSFLRHPLTHNALGREDRFQVLELQGRFYLKPRWELWFRLPYGHFEQHQTRQNARYRWQGVGDVALQLQHQVWQRGDSSFWRHSLRLGAELGLPTGHYQRRLDNGNAIEPEAQLGTGAWAGQLSMVYVLRGGAWGASAQASHRVLSRNELGYRFGSQTQVQVQLFYEWQISPQLRALPQLGLAYERRERDEVFKEPELHTGGQSLQTQAGLDVFMGSWQLGLYSQYAVWEAQPFEQPSRPWRFQLSLRRAF